MELPYDSRDSAALEEFVAKLGSGEAETEPGGNSRPAS